MIKTLFGKLFLFFPALLVMLVTNWLVDPANLHSGGRYERGIIDWITKGYNLENVQDHDDRLEQKYYIESLSHPKDVVVFGASRSWEIEKSSFPGLSFYNNSLTDARLEDYMAIYELYHERRLSPSVIVFQLDDRILNGRGSQMGRAITLQNEYKAFIARTGLPDDKIKDNLLFLNGLFTRYAGFVSIAYFNVSCLELGHILKYGGKQHYFPTLAMEGDGMMKRADGSFRWHKAWRMASPEEIRTSVIQNFDRSSNRYQPKIDRVDPFSKMQFERFIELVQQEGVKPVFFLPPFHPDFYRKLAQTGHEVFADSMEMYFRDFAKRHRILCIGSYDPSKSGVGKEDFYDDVHLRQSAAKKLFISHAL